MQIKAKPLLRALNGETLPTPPIWLMRQAGRYLPEYKATRAQAGDFLSLCYNSDLATEVTLQPISRFGLDAAIIFADILLLSQALGADLWFVEGEGPRLSTISSMNDLGKLSPAADIHEALSPIYQTVRNLSAALPIDTTLIGFAGAPWTVATYMIAGRGTPGQSPAHLLMQENTAVFDALMDRITEATILYLAEQIKAGAEVVKLFDSWAGSLNAVAFDRYCISPHVKIVTALKMQFPDVKIVGFPRGAGEKYKDYVDQVDVSCVALDTDVKASWALENLKPGVCVQGNLDPSLLVTGGNRLVEETKRVVSEFKGRPHIFNLGHGITPDASPDHVEQMIAAIRG
ncbi:MAG: uroporphyrinogen decarboxylase [Sneathiella sp.]|nr:uroporphyrinogen decarboxylase [Sneathiella sp.]